MQTTQRINHIHFIQILHLPQYKHPPPSSPHENTLTNQPKFPYPHMKKNWIHNPNRSRRVWMETEMRFVDSNESEEESKKEKKRIEDEMKRKFEKICEYITMCAVFGQIFLIYKTGKRDGKW